MREASTSQDFRHYMETKYSWSHNTSETIDWTVLHRSQSRLPGTLARFTIKFSHEWLPLNAHKGQANMEKGDLCPVCNHFPETHQHFLACTHPSMLAAWTVILHDCSISVQKIPTDPILTKLLMHAITFWRNTPQPPRPSFVPRRLYELFRSQSTIGWNQILQGRWSLQWARSHDHIQSLNKWKMNGEQTMISLLKRIWEKFFCIWLLRNDAKHGTDQRTRRDACLLRFRPKIIALYNMSIQLDRQDQQIFDRPIDEILSLPSHSMEKWVHRATALFQQALKRTKTRAKNTQTSIADHFPLQPTQVKIPLKINHTPLATFRQTRMTQAVASALPVAPSVTTRRKPPLPPPQAAKINQYFRPTHSPPSGKVDPSDHLIP